MSDHKHTYCNKGHELSGGNIRLRANSTRRECRICRNERQRNYMRKVCPIPKEQWEVLYPETHDITKFAHEIYQLELETISKIVAKGRSLR